MNRRLGVLISGRGSNLQALIDAIREGRLDADIAVVISNREDAEGLAKARGAGIEALALSHRGWPSRDDYDRALVRELRSRDVGLVCLAGFMRLVGAPLLEAFPDAVVNIHPSLLPAFKGTEVHERVIASGTRVSGCTVHYVIPELDSGPTILQAEVPVLKGDTADTLAARVLEKEHDIYPRALKLIAEGHVRLENGSVIRR